MKKPKFRPKLVSTAKTEINKTKHIHNHCIHWLKCCKQKSMILTKLQVPGCILMIKYHELDVL